MKRVLLDCDPGIDDALALLFALASDEIRLEAVSTVYGNSDVYQCTANLIGLLGLSGIKEFPAVGMGSEGPIGKKRPQRRKAHGADGLGGRSSELPGIKLDIENGIELAVSKILSGRIDTIIATGPLTNIARIIDAHSRVSDLIKMAYIMGGAIFVEGTVNRYAEFNIYCDPEAAKKVFYSKIPKTLVSLDVTREVLLTEKDLRGLDSKTGLAGFIKDISRLLIDSHKRRYRVCGAFMHDPLCVGVAVDESLCKYRQEALDVITEGPQRGRVIIKKDGPRIRHCSGVDEVRFKKIFLKRLKKISKEAEN